MDFIIQNSSHKRKSKFKFIKTELNHHAKIMSFYQFCNTEILS